MVIEKVKEKKAYIKRERERVEASFPTLCHILHIWQVPHWGKLVYRFPHSSFPGWDLFCPQNANWLIGHIMEGPFLETSMHEVETEEGDLDRDRPVLLPRRTTWLKSFSSLTHMGISRGRGTPQSNLREVVRSAISVEVDFAFLGS